MDQSRDKILEHEGQEPIPRVRQPLLQAVELEAIRSRRMRRAATTALMVAPGIKGFVPELNKRMPHDPDASKKLLAEAGYPDGFEVKLNCPNDRYVNDGEICQAVAGIYAQVASGEFGGRIEGHFSRRSCRDASFYMLGWTPGTYNPLEHA